MRKDEIQAIKLRWAIKAIGWRHFCFPDIYRLRVLERPDYVDLQIYIIDFQYKGKRLLSSLRSKIDEDINFKEYALCFIREFKLYKKGKLKIKRRSR